MISNFDSLQRFEYCEVCGEKNYPETPEQKVCEFCDFEKDDEI